MEFLKIFSLGKKCKSETENGCLECWSVEFQLQESKCIPSSSKSLEIIQKFYKESTSTAKLIFSSKLATTINLSQIVTEFIASDGETVLKSTQNPPELNIDGSGTEITIRVVPELKEFEGAKLLIKFEDPTKIVAFNNPELVFNKKEVKISPISYYNPNSQETVSEAAKGVQSATKAVMLASSVLSISTALSLIKILQMLDFLLLLNVMHPSNVSAFIQILTKSIFDDIPNLLGFLTDSSCEVQLERFVEQEVSCQTFENLGNYLIVLAFFGILKFGCFLLSRVLEKGGRWVGFFERRYLQLGPLFWLDVVEGVQLDIFMTFFLSLMKGQNKSHISELNFMVGGGLAFACVVSNFTLFYFTKKATDVTIESKGQTSKEEDKTENKNSQNEGRDGDSGGSVVDELNQNEAKKYQFLVEDFKVKSTSQRFFRPMNNIKDLVISFSLVVLHDFPFLQVGVITLCLFVMLSLALVYRPYTSLRNNILEIVKGVIYMGCCGFLLVQSLAGKLLSRKAQYQFIGYPVVVFVALLVLFNIGVGIYDSFVAAKEMIAKIKKFCWGPPKLWMGPRMLLVGMI